MFSYLVKFLVFLVILHWWFSFTVKATFSIFFIQMNFIINYIGCIKKSGEKNVLSLYLCKDMLKKYLM